MVATGSEPAFPPIDGLDGLEGVWTNREVTGMKAVPEEHPHPRRRPGRGRDGAGADRRFGAEVTVVEADDRLLSTEAPTVGEALAEAL